MFAVDTAYTQMQKEVMITMQIMLKAYFDNLRTVRPDVASVKASLNATLCLLGSLFQRILNVSLNFYLYYTYNIL